jgi:hypothetical protein
MRKAWSFALCGERVIDRRRALAGIVGREPPG